jgi:hypothetical protein
VSHADFVGDRLSDSLHSLRSSAGLCRGPDRRTADVELAGLRAATSAVSHSSALRSVGSGQPGGTRSSRRPRRWPIA